VNLTRQKDVENLNYVASLHDRSAFAFPSVKHFSNQQAEPGSERKTKVMARLQHTNKTTRICKARMMGWKPFEAETLECFLLKMA
jgi:hypothetical protein